MQKLDVTDVGLGELLYCPSVCPLSFTCLPFERLPVFMSFGKMAETLFGSLFWGPDQC